MSRDLIKNQVYQFFFQWFLVSKRQLIGCLIEINGSIFLISSIIIKKTLNLKIKIKIFIKLKFELIILIFGH